MKSYEPWARLAAAILYRAKLDGDEYWLEHDPFAQDLKDFVQDVQHDDDLRRHRSSVMHGKRGAHNIT